MSLVWDFPTAGGGDGDGVNDAGVQQFVGNEEKTIARECIQNSLDAHLDNNDPVRVVFTMTHIDRFLIPGINELNDCMVRARSYLSPNQEKARKMYDEMLRYAQKTSICILRVSDYNTTGLDGGDKKEQAGGWYYLVRSSGDSSKDANGGGSFGIGKSAPFAASILRTVFYSTKLGNGDVAFQGKSRISSFKNTDGDVRRGIGQYGIFNGVNLGVASIREENMIPDFFRRKEQGTDVFIIGYREREDWQRRIVEAIIESFYVAIYRNKLEVVVEDEYGNSIIINQQSLSEIIDRYVSDENVKLFYKTLVDPSDKFENNVPGLGLVTMYVRLGEGNRHIQGMRKTLMKITELKRLRTLNDAYTGIVIVSGDSGDGLLRNLEPPAHNEWDKERGDYESKNALDILRDWVVDGLREIAGRRKTTIEDIPDLGKYLPQGIENDSQFGPADNGTKNPNDEPVETAVEHGVTGSGDSTATSVKEREASVVKLGTSGGKKKRVKKKGGKRTGKSGRSGGDEPKGNTSYANTSKMDIRIREKTSSGKRVYSVNILPSQDDEGDIQIIGLGEGEDYPLEIKEARLVTSGESLTTENSLIKNLSFTANMPVAIELELKSSRRYRVGVKE